MRPTCAPWSSSPARRPGPSWKGLMTQLVRPHPGRFVLFTQVRVAPAPRSADFVGPGSQAAAPDGGRAGSTGSRCSRSWASTFGTSAGPLVAVGDPRFNPIWRECGRLGIPVAIHSGNPEAFFTPTDRYNERLGGAVDEPPPGASTAGTSPGCRRCWPHGTGSSPATRDTTFVALHVGGWPENLDYVSEPHRPPQEPLRRAGRPPGRARSPAPAGPAVLHRAPL